MSHFIVNQKLVHGVMNNPNYTSDPQRDNALLDLYISGEFKGGPEMMNKTVKWFIDTYPTRFSSFELFLRLQ